MKSFCFGRLGIAGAFSLLMIAPRNGLYAQKMTSSSVKIEKGDHGQRIVFGKASHYSKSLDGTLTAIGTRYRNHKLTAASNFFKLRTWVRVTRLSNDLSVVVFINDRMHKAMARKGRVIDLSVSAADKLDFMGPSGITKVKVEQIPKSEALEELNVQ